MIADILVPLLRGGGDAVALDAAIALALTHNAHLAALITVENPLPMVTEFGYLPLDVNTELFNAAREAANSVADKARSRLEREQIASEVRVTETMRLWGEETTAMHARHADLSVLGRDSHSLSDPRFALVFKALLLQSGRPVLIVPTGHVFNSQPARVVLAWRPTREATRALHDAIPLIPATAMVDVLMIDPVIAEGKHGEDPGSDIARHLARRGLQVRIVAQPKQGRSDGQAIIDHAHAVDAQLLVMGGYGHSRWREALLGGTTRTVLEYAKVPVLFSH